MTRPLARSRLPLRRDARALQRLKLIQALQICLERFGRGELRLLIGSVYGRAEIGGYGESFRPEAYALRT